MALALFLRRCRRGRREHHRHPATHRALVYQAHLRKDLPRAVGKAGGANALLACGTVMTEGFQVPMVAWNLGVRTLAVEAPPASRLRRAAVPDRDLPDPRAANSTLLPILGADHRLGAAGATTS